MWFVRALLLVLVVAGLLVGYAVTHADSTKPPTAGAPAFRGG